MAIGFDASSESHTGTTGSSSGTSFTWTHSPVSSDPKGVLVYTFTNANADNATAVTYKTRPMTAVSGGRAVDTAGEAGDCKAWFLQQQSNPATVSGAWSSLGNSPSSFHAYGNGYYVSVGGSGAIKYATDATGTWSSATSGVAVSLNDVAYSNGYWVAVGGSATILYTTDPTGTWTAATVDQSTASSLNGVTYGNGYWYAVGNSGNGYYISGDPTGTWTRTTTNNFGNGQVVKYDTGYWVVGDFNGGVYYRATDPTGAFTLAGGTSGAGSTLDVTYANGYWVASGGFGIRYRATDPAGTWSSPTSGLAGGWGVEYGDGTWVVTGQNLLGYTTDPTGTWTRAFPGNDGTSVTFLRVRYVSGQWTTITSGGSPSVWVPTAWKNIPSGDATIAVTRTSNSNVMYGVGVTVTGDYPAETTGVALEQGDQSLTEENVSDATSSTPSMRFAGINAGVGNVDLTTTTTAADTLVVGANSTGLQSIRLAGANDFTSERNYAVSTTGLATSASGTSIGSGDTTSSTFAVARTLIRGSLAASAYPADSQNWSVRYVLTGILAQYEARMKLQRLNSSGTMQTESGYGTTRTASGTFTDTLAWTPGTWAANDQLALVWEHRRTSATEVNYLVSTTALSTTSSGTSIASGSTQSATFAVAQTMVRSSIPAGYFASGSQTWTLDYTVTSMTTPDYEMRLKIQRRNSSGTMQAETAYGTTRTTNAAFTDTFTADLGTWAANDQLAVVWEHRRVSGTGNKSASITAGGTSYVTAPVPARNSSMTANGSSYVDSPTVAGFRVIGVVRETTAGQGSRPVGFQATTSDDVAAVYLAVREAIIPWTVGVPIR